MTIGPAPLISVDFGSWVRRFIFLVLSDRRVTEFVGGIEVGVNVRVLIVDQHRTDAERLVAELGRAGFELVWWRVDTQERLIEALYPGPDVILCDDETPGLGALEVLSILQRHRVESPLIVLSGQVDEEMCVKTLRMGAVDYLLKDRLARLGPAVEHALAVRRLMDEKQAAERKERETASILRGLVAHARRRSV